MNNPLDLEAIKREYPHIAQGGNIPTLDLDAIRKRAESATAGPWTTSGPDTIGQWVIYDSEWAVAHAAAYDHNNVLSDRPGARGPRPARRHGPQGRAVAMRSTLESRP